MASRRRERKPSVKFWAPVPTPGLTLYNKVIWLSFPSAAISCRWFKGLTRLGLMNETSSGTALPASQHACLCESFDSHWVTSVRHDIHQRISGCNPGWDALNQPGTITRVSSGKTGRKKKRRAWNSDPCCVRHLRLGRIVFVFKLYIHWTGIKKIDSKEEGKMRNETDRREGEPEHRLVSCFYAWFHGLCESISRCTWLMLLWWSACVLSVPLFF